MLPPRFGERSRADADDEPAAANAEDDDPAGM